MFIRLRGVYSHAIRVNKGWLYVEEVVAVDEGIARQGRLVGRGRSSKQHVRDDEGGKVRRLVGRGEGGSNDSARVD